jgi:hypothetical protein
MDFTMLATSNVIVFKKIGYGFIFSSGIEGRSKILGARTL